MALIQFKYKVSHPDAPGFVIQWMTQQRAAKLRRKGYIVVMVEE